MMARWYTTGPYYMDVTSLAWEVIFSISRRIFRLAILKK